MTTQSQYNYFARIVIAFAILASIVIFLVAGGVGALVLWVAPDVGSGTQQAFIDNAKPDTAHAANHTWWSSPRERVFDRATC